MSRQRVLSKPGAVSCFTIKARTARSGHRGHVSAATHSLEAGSRLPAYKKNESASVTRRLVFFMVKIFSFSPTFFGIFYRQARFFFVLSHLTKNN
ncbi:MAG: hypothetical protein FWF77_08475 [Defluviitaleaceae bacterium]|nr:hypothetical protein [Defluviitaleaceae bacterium]